MTCEQAQPYLGALVDGELTDEQLHPLEAHLEQCSRCRAYVRQLNALTRVATQALSPVQPPETYWQTLPEQILSKAGLTPTDSTGEKKRTRRSGVVIRHSLGWGLAAAAVLVAVLFTGRRWLHEEMSSTVAVPKTATKTGPEPVQEQDAGTKALVAPAVRQETREVAEDRLARPAPPADEQGQQSARPLAGAVHGAPVGDRELFDSPTRKSRSRGEGAASWTASAAPLAESAGTEQPADRAAAEADMRALAPSNTTSLRTLDKSRQGKAAHTLDFEAPGVQSGVTETKPAAAPLPGTARLRRPRTYAAAVWLSQSAGTLEERQKIWSAFLESQADSVYRSLALARLAATLVELAEVRKDSAQVRRSLEFLQRHRLELRRLDRGHFDSSVFKLRSMLQRDGAKEAP